MPLTTLHSSQQKNFSHIKHLREFYQPQRQLFSDAIDLPQFFKTNLVDDMRVVKHFHNDPQANITIFYYQYLKLCFQIDNVDYQSYIQKIYQLIRTEGFQFYFQASDPQKEVKNAQYKSLLIDFFQLMNTSSMTIDNILREYPILQNVFTNFFRTVVMIASITPTYDSFIEKNELFDFLSSFFSVDISSYEKCLKFVQSDIFVYQQDERDIYMAYIAQQQQQDGSSGHNRRASNSNNNNSHLLNNEMKTVKEDEYESEVSGNTDQNNPNNPQLGIRLLTQHTASNSLLVPSTDHEYHSNNNLSAQQRQLHKPRAKTIIKQSYIQSQFADYTSFSNNNMMETFGKDVNVQEGQEQEKEVCVEMLEEEEKNTAEEQSREGGLNNNNNNTNDYVINYQQTQQRQLTRVQSAQYNPIQLTQLNRAQSQQIQINSPLYNKLSGGHHHNSQQQQQNSSNKQISKSTSQPNFLYRQRSLNQLAQSCFQSLDSNLQGQEEQNVQRQQSRNQLQQQQMYVNVNNNQNDNENERIIKKKILSLGLQQQGHMYVSYQQPYTYVNYEQPTKDPGFMQKEQQQLIQKDLTAMCVEEVLPIQQQQQQQNNYSNNKFNAQQLQQKNLLLTKPTYKQQSSYKPQQPQPQPQNSPFFTTNGRMVQSQNSQQNQPMFYNPTINNNNNYNKLTQPLSSSIITQKLRLNVTRQFTNSIVMKSMSQPYKTQVYNSRERAREFRKNIYNQFITSSSGSNYNSSSVNNNNNAYVLKVDYNSYTSKVSQNNKYTSKLQQYNNNAYNMKKPSSRTSIPSQSQSLKTISAKNIPILLQPYQSISSFDPTTNSNNSNKPSSYQYQQQQSTYPISMMVKQQNNKVYNIVGNNNNNLLSKVSELKQISQNVSSQSVSRKSINIEINSNNNNLNSNSNNNNLNSNTNKSNNKNIENSNKSNPRQQVSPFLLPSSSTIQGQYNKVTVSNFKSGIQTYHTNSQTNNTNNYNSNTNNINSGYKLPTYQPVLITTPKTFNLPQSQQQHLKYPQHYISNNNNTPPQLQQPKTIMPHNHHYHHTPTNNYSNITSANTYPNNSQGLMGLIPQAHKPLPLYVPFQRRK